MQFEPLESRCLMSGAPLPVPDSVAPQLAGGVLTVTGTAGHDRITVARGPGGRLVVTELVSDAPTDSDGDLVFGESIVAARRTAFAQSAVTRLVVNAGAGDDLVQLNPEGHTAAVNSQINGGAGNDVLRGGSGSDAIHGNGGADRINGGGGTDTIDGDEGRDYLIGGEGADTLRGGAGSDIIFAFDKVQGGLADTIDGGAHDTKPRNGINGDLALVDALDRPNGTESQRPAKG
jgi:Ca2+-binding RTX toxin-like protein